MISNRPATLSKKEGYIGSEELRNKPSDALILGLLTATSVLAGGLATAWWYRKTIAKLQNPILLDSPESHDIDPEMEEEEPWHPRNQEKHR